jgi:dolichyldiphosphatase
MPSTHSASITFLATYVLLACLYLPAHPAFPAYMRVAPMVVVPYALGVVVSRVWLGHHSWLQVLAGASYGIVFGIIWFELWRSGLNEQLGLLEMGLKAWINRYLSM